MNRHRIQLVPSVLLAALLAHFGLVARAEVSIAPTATAATERKDFSGSRSCRDCHERFYQLWAPSHHGLAMQPYSSARTNLTEHKTELQVAGCGYRADIAKGRVVARTPQGEKFYPMEQVLGGKNVFYFLTPLERGRLQVLPLAYDLRRQEWFDTAGSALRHFPMQPDEPLHWTESPYSFNTSCFSCHVSQLTNNYDVSADAYHTTWAEPGINCETCHGPASEHVRLARQTPKGQPLEALNLISLKNFAPDKLNALCGSCHAKMYPLTYSFSPGDRFYDHFGLTALEQADFYPDGRDLGENFTYTTWRLSPCLKSGTLNCVTCHTSSGRYRFTGEKANDACLPCHEGKVSNVAAHSHHKGGSQGAECVSCHMPMTEFARMRRSDHSMRPPMPAATLAYGSPNACNLCHTNQDAAWADRQVRQWYKDDYQAPVLQRAGLIAAARKHDWSKLPEMVTYLSAPEREEIWTASLLQLLRACDDEAKWASIRACVKDPSPLVRAAAAEALGEPLRAEAIAPLLAATRDDFRLVRIRAARALASAPGDMIPEPARKSLSLATDELLASFRARPDDSASVQSLGNLHLERREYRQAIEAFQRASKLQPRDIPPLVNISLAYNLAGQNDKAEASLRRALTLEPTNAAIHLNLGMLLAEMERLPEAERAFRAAFEYDSKSAQAAFNLGVLLAKEHPEEALAWSRRAAELRPREPRYAYTLAFFQNQQGKLTEAAQTLEELVRQSTSHADAYALLVQIYERQGKISAALSVCRRATENQKLSQQERDQFQARIGILSPK
jgi:Flp pilus assembly protein TadD